MDNIDYNDKALKRFNLDEPILKLIKEKAQELNMELWLYLASLRSLNIRQQKPKYSTPTEEDIKTVEEEIKSLRKIAHGVDNE